MILSFNIYYAAVSSDLAFGAYGIIIRNQFIVYGSLYAGAGIVFAAVFAVILPLTSSAKSSNAVLSASMTESGMNPER